MTPGDSNSTISRARDLLQARIGELDDERKRLQGAIRELGSVRAAQPPARSTAPGRRRRTRRGGTRAQQVLKLIGSDPGLSSAEIASRLGINPNYVYRVMSDLLKDKLVVKKDRRFFSA